MLTACTGCAATETGGETTTEAFGLARRATFVGNGGLMAFVDLRMAIVDEVSFLGHDRDLKKLSDNLQMLTQCRDFRYGKRPIVFLGDFRQLFPVGGKSILLCPNSSYWSDAINCMVELRGAHRFNKCETMREMMPALHQNGLSEKHRKIPNGRAIDGKKLKHPPLETARAATFHSKPRAEHGRSVFREHLNRKHSGCKDHNMPKQALVIKSEVAW